MTWIQTASGRQYWPLDPRPGDVRISDIAAHLSKICRFNGACEPFYSVAEHSVFVSYIVPVELALHGLLHDAAEAYCHDIMRPIKHALGGYREIEAANHEAVRVALGMRVLDPDEAAVIKHADNAAVMAEHSVLMAPKPAPWAPLGVPEWAMRKAMLWSVRNGLGIAPDRAGAFFMARYVQLAGEELAGG